MAYAQQVGAFFAQHPLIPYFTPQSPQFTRIRATYIEDSLVVPLGIARPRSADDVAIIVRFAASIGIDFTVRTGGHDLFGRGFVQDGLAIDMRDIEYVHVDTSQKTAKVGGGTLAIHVAKKLCEYGMATALGSYPTVGYVGWATHGGYGPFAANYGLGVDQIVGARVVNAAGQIVQADEDMLVALRGGGGAVGVIVEVTIKVYALKSVLGGVIVFTPGNLRNLLHKYLDLMRDLRKVALPPQLGVQQSVVNTPQGKSIGIGFVWSSEDTEMGSVYLKQFLNLGEILHNRVQPLTVPEWLEISGSLPPKSCYGAICCVRVRQETLEVEEVLARMAEVMPDDPATLFSVHEVRGISAQPKSNSVFLARENHFLIECIGTSSTAAGAEISWKWAREIQAALNAISAENIVPGAYLPLTPPREVDPAQVYGQHWQRLRTLKEQHDPKNIFRHTLIKF